MDKSKRLRDLDLSIGRFPPGATNTLVDVPGVRVGQCDVRGESEGKRIHTGVTVIVPGPGNLWASPLPAAVDIFNGYGKSAGIVQIQELGLLESPIFLCSTLNVGRVWDAAASIILEQNPRAITANPAVFECNDFRFNDARGRHVGERHVRAAHESANSDPPALGGVGAGSGTTAFGYKGGIGSASRIVPTDARGPIALGVLSFNNFGGRLVWQGREIRPSVPQADPAAGSVIVVVATTAPWAPNLLRRLAKRAWAGIGRMGSRFGQGSGDIAVAFALPSPDGVCPPQLDWRAVDRDLDAMFEAVADATEESVWDCMLLAGDATAADGKTIRALRPDELLKEPR